ncbi:STAS domain-containing protein [Saccharopolyspora sp. NPDC000359]|uniref:STAS domain-containing protein n=1 Tax=Saccharopolyspora sp. NPDC000359 TaxID=3154251 RepID=UPI00333038F2
MVTPTDPDQPQVPLNVLTRWSDRTLLVEVAGEIELINAPRVEELVDNALDEKPEALVLDLTGVTFLSSAGLAMLVRARNRAGDDVEFRVVVGGPATARPVQLTGLDQEIDVFSSLEKAMAASA